MRSARLGPILLAFGLTLIVLGGNQLAAAAATSDVSVKVFGGPDSSAPELPFSFSVEVATVGPDAAGGTVVSVEQPGATGLVVPNDCVATGGATCPTDWAVAGAKLTGTVTQLPANGKIIFSFTGKFAKSFGSGASVSTAGTVMVPEGVSDPVLSSNASVQSTSFPKPALELSKTATHISTAGVPLATPRLLGAGDSIPIDSVVDWTMTIKNPSSVPVTGFVGRDELYPEGGLAVEVLPGATCDRAGQSCSLVWTLGVTKEPLVSQPLPQLGPGETLTIKYQTKMSRSGCGSGLIHNTLWLTGNNLPLDAHGLSPYIASPTFRVLVSACITLEREKSARIVVDAQGVPVTNPTLLGAGDPVPVGSTLEWTITLRNPSTTETITQSLGRDESYEPHVLMEVLPGGTCDRAGQPCSLTWTTGLTNRPLALQSLPDLGPGETLTIRYRTKYPAIGCGTQQVHNTLFLSGPNFPDPWAPESYVQSPRYNLVAGDCINLEMSRSAAKDTAPGVPLAAGESVSLGTVLNLTITIKNPAAVPVTNFRIKEVSTPDNQPREVLPGGTCDLGGQPCSLSWTTGLTANPLAEQSLPDLGPGQTLTIRYSAKIVANGCYQGAISNTVQVAGDQLVKDMFGLGPKLKSADYQLATVDLAATISASPTAPKAGTSVTLSATVNNGCAGSTSAELSWTLPPVEQFGFTEVTSTSLVCTPPTGLTCPNFAFAADSRKLTAAFATVDSRSFTVAVMAPAGLVKGKTVPATVELLPILGDANPGSNTASISFDINNAKSTIQVEHRITTYDRAGVLLAGVPAELSVTGVLTCVGQKDFPLSQVIAKDAQSPAGLWEQLLWNEDTCEYQIGAVAAPDGWRWKSPLATTAENPGGAAILTVDRRIVVAGELEPVPLPLAIEKVAGNCDVNQPSCLLSGAAFVIYSQDPTVAGASVSGNLVADPAANPAGSRFLVSGLTPGDYWLVESRTPTGFSLLATPVKFRLAVDHSVTLLGADGGIATVRPGSAVASTTLVIHDPPTAELPKAGGPGVWWWSLVGLLLVVSGGFWGWRASKS